MSEICEYGLVFTYQSYLHFWHVYTCTSTNNLLVLFLLVMVLFITVVDDRVTKEHDMLTPEEEDVLSVETESNDNQGCHVSGSANTVLNTEVDIVDSELSTCSDTEPEMNIAQPECLLVSGTTDESCVTGVSGVEIQRDKSDTISRVEDTDLDCIIQGVSKSGECEHKETGGTQEDESKVTSERESIQNRDTCDPAEPLVDSELSTFSGTLPKTNSAQQECLSVGNRRSVDNCIVFFNEDTGDMQEYEVKVSSETDSDSDCIILDVSRSEEFNCEEAVCMQKDEVKLISETKSADIVHQHKNSETCAPAVPLVESELSDCSDMVPNRNSAVDGDAHKPANESCVAEISEVEIQHDRSDMISTLEETDSDCIIQHASRNEELDRQPPIHVDEMVVDLLDDDDDDDMPMINTIVQQECLPVYGVAVGLESEICVTDIAEVEIQYDKSDTIATDEESDSDCVIQGVSRREDWDLWPAENEGEIGGEVTFDLMDNDHSYCRSDASLQCSTVLTSSNEICREYTLQAGSNFSLSSMQTHAFNMPIVVPFPSLITQPNSDELSRYSHFPGGENAVDNASVYRVAHSELIDTDISRTSSFGTENGCSVVVDSSYPVVEIVPCCDGEEVNISEQSGTLLQEPCGTAAADVDGSSNAADVHSDSAALSSVAGPNIISRRARASIEILV